MSKKRQNIIVFLVVAGFVIFLAYTSRPPEEWVPTWHHRDRDPYGGYVTHDLLGELFPGQPVRSEFRSLYELLEMRQNEGDDLGSLLLVNQSIGLDEKDGEALREYLESGQQVLIAAEGFGGGFFEELGVATALYPDEDLLKDLTHQRDVGLQFVLEGFPQAEVEVEALAATRNFTAAEDSSFTRLAVNDREMDVIREYKLGEGTLYLVTNPLLLSNYFVLDSSASAFTAGIFSLLPADRPLTHVEFYRMGRMEAQTPLRYFLSQPRLRAAVYVSITGLLLFMIFEARRKQRVIPVEKPPKNTSVEFAETLGQLYFHSKGDHLNMARKRVNYLLEYIRNHYYLSTGELDDKFVQNLAERSGYPVKKLRTLMQYVRNIREGHITENQFLILEKLLSQFYGTEPTKSQ